MIRAICFAPGALYKPEFAFATPAGYRDEMFMVPFQFTVPGTGQAVNNLSIQMDDDQPFFFRALVFPQIGIFPNADQGGPQRSGGAMRLRDGLGNAMSEGLVLTWGPFGQCGLPDVNAFGFPVTDELPVVEGGALVLDLQMGTNATFASKSHVFGGTTLEADANVYGVGGNGYTLTLVNPGAPNVPLSIATGAGAVTVTLATDGGGIITTTVAQLVAAVNADAGALGVLSTQFFGAGTDLCAAAVIAMAGGTAARDIVVAGTLVGVKRFKECGA